MEIKKIPNKVFLLTTVILLIAFSCKQEDKITYKNPDASIEERVDDLLSRMTLEEKFWQLWMTGGDLSIGKDKYEHSICGMNLRSQREGKDAADQILDYEAVSFSEDDAKKVNETQKYFLNETRLGIPIIPFDEALHGLIRAGATSFPQSIGLAATWNTETMKQVSTAISMETKSRGYRWILSPVINIARDVRWGRVEETYGEDPFLTSKMGVAFVSSFEENGVITTPKHFVANVGDGGRDSYPIHFNERLLEEIYFPAYKACIMEGKSKSVMTSYNSLNGRQCTANNWLLNKKLKEEWGFKGIVISDAGATGGANVLHFTAKDYTESTIQAMENGLDVMFQGNYGHYPLFWDAFEKGLIDPVAIDNAVKRVLRLKFELGLFENPFVDVDIAKKWNGSKEHRKLAKKAAQESIVLLKNNNNILPLDKSIMSIAVIGTDAVEARLGGYSGPGITPVSLLQGIQNKMEKSCQINYSPACGRESKEFDIVSADNLFHYENGQKKKGLVGVYFNNTNLQGKPALSRIDPQIDFRWTLFSPDQEKINYDWYSVRWTGKLLASETGKFEIGLKGDDGYRLYINDELIVDNWRKQTFQQITTNYNFKKGVEYDIKIEFFETVGNVWLKLVWNMGVDKKWKKEIYEAVVNAKKSDVAVVVVGIEEGEFRDRAYLSLPGHQEELINAVAAIGKPMVVVLVGGSAVTMNNWIGNVSAILDVWYPGEEGGNAVADVLFGDYSPAGRLPITFPIHEAQLPLYYNHKPTGRGDDYLNLTGKPLFPFGYGLSYTDFHYSELIIDSPVIGSKESTSIRFKITNTGYYDGDEVVQLYIKDLLASVVRPVMELKGFQRIHMKKGETKEVVFEITPELLAMLNINLKRIVEPGDFRIMVGASSKDIRLRKILKVRQ